MEEVKWDIGGTEKTLEFRVWNIQGKKLIDITDLKNILREFNQTDDIERFIEVLNQEESSKRG